MSKSSKPTTSCRNNSSCILALLLQSYYAALPFCKSCAYYMISLITKKSSQVDCSMLSCFLFLLFKSITMGFIRLSIWSMFCCVNLLTESFQLVDVVCVWSIRSIFVHPYRWGTISNLSTFSFLSTPSRPFAVMALPTILPSGSMTKNAGIQFS